MLVGASITVGVEVVSRVGSSNGTSSGVASGALVVAPALGLNGDLPVGSEVGLKAGGDIGLVAAASVDDGVAMAAADLS